MPRLPTSSTSSCPCKAARPMYPPGSRRRKERFSSSPSRSPPSPIIGTWLASSSCVTCVFVTHLSDTNYHRRMQAGLAEPERAQRATSPLGPWAHIRHHGRKAVHARRTEVPSQTRSRRGRARGARCRCSTATTWTAPTTTSAPPSSWRTSADSRPPNPSTARPRRRFDCQPDRRCAKTVKSG